MSEKFVLPSDDVMRQMAKMAVERSTTYFAEQAEAFAKDMRASGKTLDGPAALEAFARAIRSTNHEIYPPEGPQQ